MKTSNAVLGILGGLAVGTILGVLIAPDKGSNTRAKLLKKGKDFANNANERFEEVADNFLACIHHAKEESEIEGENVLDKIEHFLNKGFEALTKAKNEVGKTTADAKK